MRVIRVRLLVMILIGVLSLFCLLYVKYIFFWFETGPSMPEDLVEVLGACSPPKFPVLRGWSQFSDRLLEIVSREREAFRKFGVESVRGRVVPGPLSLHVIYNPLRLNLKRAPDKEVAVPTRLKQRHRAGDFSFANLPAREVLLCVDSRLASQLEREGRGPCAEGDTFAEAEVALLLQNSPIDGQHFLLVPRPLGLQRQRITRAAVEDTFHMVSRSDLGLVAGFNGVGGWATINHEHFQAYRLNRTRAPDGKMPIQRLPRVPVTRRADGRALAGGGVEWLTVPMWPARNVVVKGREARAVARAVNRCFEVLEDANLPMNALFFFEAGDFLAVLFLRRLGRAQDAAVEVPGYGKGVTDFRPGFPELSGHVIIKDNEDFFERATEEDLARLLRQQDHTPAETVDVALEKCALP